MNDAAIAIALKMVDQATGPMQRAFAGIDKQTAALERTMAGLRTAVGMVGAAFAAVGVSMGAGEVIRIADSWNNVNGRLRLVADSAAQLAEIQDRLFGVAQESRVAYEQTADLYARIARSTRDMNLGYEQTIGITETINKSLIISGASAESANAALIQLGQGFASGQLRGEELNSVLEQTPRLAQAIADGMGVSVGKLRELGKEGQLSAEAVTKALVSQADAIAKEFDRMPKTVGQAMTVMNNSIGKMIFGVDQAGGATAALAGWIIELAGAMDVWAGKNKEAIAGWIKNFQLGLMSVQAEIMRVAMLIDKLGGTMTFLASLPSAIPAVLGIQSSQDRMQRLADWNIRYEERYQETERALQALAQRYNEIESGAASAAKSTGDFVKTQAKTTAATKAGTDAAKDNQKELDRLIDRYLPLRQEAEEIAAAEAGLAALRDKGAISAADYAVAMDNLRQSTTAYKEAVKGELELQENVSRLRDEEYAARAAAIEQQEQMVALYDEMTLAVLPGNARQIEEVRRQYAEMKSDVETLFASTDMTATEAQRLVDGLDAAMDRDLNAIEESNKETATAISDTWKHAFEQIQDALADMLYKFEFSWSSILDLARRGAAEYAAALIMQPFTGAQAGGAGGGSLSFGNLFSSAGWGGMQANLSAFALDGLGMEGASQWIMGQNSSIFGSGLAGVGALGMGLLSGQSVGQSGAAGLGAFLGGMTPLGPLGSVIGGAIGNWLGGSLFGDDIQRGYLGTGYRYDYTPGVGFLQTDSAEWREDRNGEDFREASAALSDSLLGALNTISGSFESLFSSLGRGSQYSEYLDQFGASAGGSRSYVNDPRIVEAMYGPGGLSAGTGSTLDLNAFISGEDEDEIARSIENIWQSATAGIIAPLVAGSADMLAEAMEGSFAALDLSMFSSTAAEKLQGGLTDAIDLMRIGEITDTESLERELSELESGLGQARYVIDYVTEVVGLLGQIDDSIVSGNLTDAGRELESINAKYDEMAGTLERLGVVVSETNLELARTEEINRLTGRVTGSWQDIIDQNTMGEFDLARKNLEKWRDEETKKAMELGLATGLLTRAYDVQLDKINEAEEAFLAAEAIAGLNEEIGLLTDSLSGLEGDLSAVRGVVDSIDAKRLDIAYSGFNLAYPSDRVTAATGDYSSLLAAAGTSPEAAGEYLNFVNTYLTEAQSAYKSSQQYLDIYDRVMSDLDSLGLTYQTQEGLLTGSIDSLTRQIAALEERIAGLEANVTVIVVDESGNEVSRTTETRRIIQNDDARIVRAAA